MGFSGLLVLVVGIMVVINQPAAEGSPSPGTCLPVNKGGTGVCSQDDLIDFLYPIGFIYTSTSDTNPGDYLGGTWEAFGDGRTLVGVGDNGTTDYSDGEETGGADEVALSEATMPNHRHTQGLGRTWSWGSITAGTEVMFTGTSYVQAVAGNGTGNPIFTNPAGGYTAFTGGGQPHENRMPYITVYFWKRVS